MSVQYNKLFKLMIDRKLSTTDLRRQAGFSANIIMKLKKDQYISLDNVERIYTVLNCGVDDILEFIPEKIVETNHG